MDSIVDEPKKVSEVRPTTEQEKRDADAETEIEDLDSPDVDSPASVSDRPLDLDDDDKDLTPPPDTPDEVLSEDHRGVELEDEIVVGTKANNSKPSPARTIPEVDDVDMDDADDDMPAAVLKRKRPSYASMSSEDKDDSMMAVDSTLRARMARPAKVGEKTTPKGVILGYWRESKADNLYDKHAVTGFLDARDRLRTRTSTINRNAENIAKKYPFPTGPGGTWVTFDKIVFDDHLVNLDHHQVKEYVKIRSETLTANETPAQRQERDNKAVQEAIQRLIDNPPPEQAQPVHIAYGLTIPDHRPELKRRKTTVAERGGQQGPQGQLGQQDQPTQQFPPASATTSFQDTLPGTRPTRILLGFWKKSSEERLEDKHAVYGILGLNDMFRVKLVRETRDGRMMLGNFPQGPGALWITWEDVEFEPHLRGLPRADIKEYCRVRQRQIDDGETPAQRAINEVSAVEEAKSRVIKLGSFVPTNRDGSLNMASLSLRNALAANGTGPDDDYTFGGDGVGQELRQSRRTENATRAARHSMPNLEFQAANRGQAGDMLERTNILARREVARIEAAQLRADQRAASREEETAANTNTNKSIHNDNISRLNKVWAAQEASRLQAGGDDDEKIYMGIKFERKSNGPFAGKLVSKGTIISIDGEDYVEYRVLTKPTFF